MRYVRAQDVFPAELLQLIQTYVDGEYIYVPRREEHRKAWGEQSRCRQELSARNAAIYADYRAGVGVAALAGSYYLSEKSILRILRQQRKGSGPEE